MAVAKGVGYEFSTVATMSQGKRAITGSMAIRIARFAGASVDEVLAGKWPAPGTCPKCGHHPRSDPSEKASCRSMKGTGRDC
jgi:hypothetical protein